MCDPTPPVDLGPRAELKTQTFTETQVEATGTDPDEAVENFEEEVGGPTWTRTRDQPVMSRWL